MALTAMPGRRRPQTYGKKTSRQPQYHFTDDDFEFTGEDRTRKKAINLATTSPRIARVTSPNDGPAVFDVPSSDNDDHSDVYSDVQHLAFSSTAKSRTVSPSDNSTVFDIPLSDEETPMFHSPRRSQPLAKKRKMENAENQKPDREAASAVKYTASEFARDMHMATSGQCNSQSYDKKPPTKRRKPPRSVQESNFTFAHSSILVGQSKKHPKRPITRKLPAQAISENSDLLQRRAKSQSPNSDISLPPTNASERSESPSQDSFDVPMTPAAAADPATPPSTIRRIATTPRQEELWKSLFEDNDLERMMGTPYSGLQKLSLSQTNLTSQPAKFESPRRRLIDTLRADTPSIASEADSSEFDQMQIDEASKVDIIQTENMATSSQQKRAEPQLGDNGQNISAKNSQGTERGPRVTYAQHRSYLDDSSQNLEDLLKQPLDLGINTTTKYPDQELSEDEDDRKHTFRGIHELRAGGDATKFTDEILGLTMDIKSTLSAKRSALIDLSTNLTQEGYKAQFLQHAYTYRVFSLCTAEQDSISGFAIASVVAILLEDKNDTRSSSDLLEAGILDTLPTMLDMDKDITAISKERRTNMSKFAQVSVSKLRDALQQRTQLWGRAQPTCISPRLLALKAIELQVRRLRESRNAENLLHPQLLDKMLSLMETSIPAIKQDSMNKSLHHIQMEVILSILESFTIAPSCAFESVTWTDTRLKRLLAVLEIMFEALPLSQALVLRLCVNLANNNRRITEIFAASKLVSMIMNSINFGFNAISDLSLAGEDDNCVVDTLVLSLGALNSLIDASDGTKCKIYSMEGHSIAKLIGVFVQSRKSASQAESLAASRANVAFGWLAVLLGTFCQESSISRQVKKQLSSGRLDLLVDAIEEFIDYNKEVDRREQTNNDVWVAFTNRLQTIVETLRVTEHI